MIDFIDLEGNRHGAITQYSVRHGVNGEKSLSGTVYTNEEVIHGIDKGWRLEVNNEFYVVTFGVPVDTGNRTQLEFDAVHEFFYEMSKDVVYDTLSGSNTATRYLNFIFDGSGYEYRLEIDVPAFSKDNFGMENRLALFKDFVQTTGVEFVVNNRVVRILREVGSDLSTIVKKGFNLQELRLEKNISEFVTVKRGYGAFFDDENPEAGRLEVEYKSPLVEIFGELHADPIVDERFSVPENLEERLKEDVENSYNISVQLTMEDLTKAGYEYERPETGDYILAMNEDLGFEQRVRIVSYESHYDVEGNIIDHDVTCNSIGVAQRSTGSAGFRNTINRALENAERALEIANHAQVSADGNTMNYYGETDPRELGYEVRLGDTWFQVSGEDRIIQTWNGAEWEPLINTAHTDEVSRRVEEAISEAQDAKAQVERESEERRADIQAESERLSAEWNERIEENEQIVEDIRHSTEELMDDFDRALAQANFTSLEDLTTTLNSRSLEAIENARESIEIAERADGFAVEALNIVNGFGTRITDVESTVDGQVTSINTAIETAERVERTISEVTNDVDGLSSRFVSMEVDIEGITNTVSDYEGRISRTEQRADGLYDVVHDPDTGLLTEVGQIAEGWQVTAQRIDDMNEDMATQADITLLYDAIDLAVEEGDVVGRLNVQAGHTLIQNGEILMDADTVRFTGSAFIPNAAIEEVSANKIIGNDGQFNTLRSRFLTSNVIESDHLNVTTAMIDRFFANSALIERLTSRQAFIDQLSASNLEIDGGRVHGTLNGNSLNFVNIDVNSLSGNLSEFVRTQWNNATNGHVGISGDGITTSGINFELTIADGALETIRRGIDQATGNQIITGQTSLREGYLQLYSNPTSSAGIESEGSLSGNRLYMMNHSTGRHTSLSGNGLEFQVGGEGGPVRIIEATPEGLIFEPHASNTGTNLNTSLHLIGGASGSYQYIQFISGNGINQRIETLNHAMNLYHGDDGRLWVRKYNGDDHSGFVRAAVYETSHVSGNTLEIRGDTIQTPRSGSRNIFLTPQGTGAVISGAPGGIRYNVNASDFVRQSTRKSKTNIKPLEEGLSVIRALKPVSYYKKDKLDEGIVELEKGFISEDSKWVATPDGEGIYDSHITAYLVKSMQQMDTKVINIKDYLDKQFEKIAYDNLQRDLEIKRLKERVAQLEKGAS